MKNIICLFFSVWLLQTMFSVRPAVLLIFVMLCAGMMGRGGDRGGFPPRGGPRGAMAWGGPPGANNVPKRAGDWECPNPWVCLSLCLRVCLSVHLVESMWLTSCCVCSVVVGTRTLRGGLSVTSAKLQDLRAWYLLQVTHMHTHLQLGQVYRYCLYISTHVFFKP